MKINSKRIKDQHAWPKTIKLLEENTGKGLHIIGLAMILRYNTKGTVTKEKLSKLGFMKMENLSLKRHCPQSKKAAHRLGENICNHVSDKGLIARISREFLKLNVLVPWTR